MMPGQGQITRELPGKRHYLHCKDQTTRELPGKGQELQDKG